MAITLLDVVIHKVGEKETYTGQDFEDAGVPMFGGCQSCGASLGGYNSYPSKTGFIRCHDCLGDLGFNTVEEFLTSEDLPENEVTINEPWDFPDEDDVEDIY